MNNLKDIHNWSSRARTARVVVLSRFQWTIWRIYTTRRFRYCRKIELFCQDFNEQFEGYTQHTRTLALVSPVVLSRFQWTIWRIYTTTNDVTPQGNLLFCQDFNEQFEGYTQPRGVAGVLGWCCFVKISMNNLKDIHNWVIAIHSALAVVLSRFQWTIWRIYTTCQQYLRCRPSCFVKISMNNLKDIHNS